MLRPLLTSAALACAVLLLPACKSEEKAEPAKMSSTAPAMGALNDVCPVSGKPVSSDAPTAEYMGHTIGFCCGGCVSRWNAESAADKKAFVSKYTK